MNTFFECLVFHILNLDTIRLFQFSPVHICKYMNKYMCMWV